MLQNLAMFWASEIRISVLSLVFIEGELPNCSEGRDYVVHDCFVKVFQSLRDVPSVSVPFFHKIRYCPNLNQFQPKVVAAKRYGSSFHRLNSRSDA